MLMQLSWPELLGARQPAGNFSLSLLVHSGKVGKEGTGVKKQEQELEGGSGGHLDDQGGR